MPDDLVIRPLTRQDLPQALAIQSASYPAFLVEPEDAFASRLDAPMPACLAALRGGELAGYLLAHGWPRQTPPPVATVLAPDAPSEVLFIHDLAVGSAGRGLGLGRQLIAHAFAMAAGHGLARAELIAIEGASEYWRALGFAEEPVPASVAAKVAAYGAGARWMSRDIPAPPGA